MTGEDPRRHGSPWPVRLSSAARMALAGTAASRSWSAAAIDVGVSAGLRCRSDGIGRRGGFQRQGNARGEQALCTVRPPSPKRARSTSALTTRPRHCVGRSSSLRGRRTAAQCARRSVHNRAHDTSYRRGLWCCRNSPCDCCMDPLILGGSAVGPECPGTARGRQGSWHGPNGPLKRWRPRQ